MKIRGNAVKSIVKPAIMKIHNIIKFLKSQLFFQLYRLENQQK